MQTLMLGVFIIGGGFWAYRQWLAVQALGVHTPPSNRPSPPATPYRDPSHVIIETGGFSYPPSSHDPVSQGNSGGINKYVLALICAAWIISPLDGDWFPVIGWADDLVAAIVGVRALIRK